MRPVKRWGQRDNWGGEAGRHNRQLLLHPSPPVPTSPPLYLKLVLPGSILSSWYELSRRTAGRLGRSSSLRTSRSKPLGGGSRAQRQWENERHYTSSIMSSCLESFGGGADGNGLYPSKGTMFKVLKHALTCGYHASRQWRTIRRHWRQARRSPAGCPLGRIPATGRSWGHGGRNEGLQREAGWLYQ